MVSNGLEVTITYMKQKIITKHAKQVTILSTMKKRQRRPNTTAESQKCLTTPHKSTKYLTPVQVFQQPQWGWSSSKTIETQNLPGKKRGHKTEVHIRDQLARIHLSIAFVFVKAPTRLT